MTYKFTFTRLTKADQMSTQIIALEEQSICMVKLSKTVFFNLRADERVLTKFS